MALRENISILLPFCVEMKKDLLLEIVQHAIWHTKIKNEYTDAVMSGMTAKTLCVKSYDLLVDWSEFTSKSQELRQHQLLGYWAAKNFPSLGKKLYGDNWKALPRLSVEVIGGEAMTPDAVDTIINRKMKLRAMKLTVSPKTIAKLKAFVRTPKDTASYNATRISSTISSFDIEDGHIDKCWEQLRYGNPPMSESRSDSNEPGQTNTAEATDVPSDKNDLSVRAVKRQHTSKAKKVATQNGPHLIPLVKRMHFDFTNNTDDAEASVERASGSQMMHATQPINDSFQTLLLEMRKEIENLSERLTSATQMRTTDEDLRKENELLKQHLEANKTLISSLQMGVESSNKLYHMLELSSQRQTEDSAKNLAEAEKIKTALSKQNSALKAELYELKHFVADSHKCSNEQIEDLKARLVETETVKQRKTLREVKQENTNLQSLYQDRIHELNKHDREAVAMSEKIKSLEAEIIELQSSIHTKDVEIIEARKSDKNLNMLKEYAASMAKDLKNKIAEVEKALAETHKMNLELALENEKLESELQRMVRGSDQVEGGTDRVTVVEQVLDLNNVVPNEIAAPMVRGDAIADQVEGGMEKVAVVEQGFDDLNLVVPNENQWTDPNPNFISNDPIVRECRPNLARLPFGWMKFHKMKSAKYYNNITILQYYNIKKTV